MSYDDPRDSRNGPTYRSGKVCCVRGCNEPAGTAWGPLFCVKHNIERMRRIDQRFEDAAKSIKPKDAE